MIELKYFMIQSQFVLKLKIIRYYPRKSDSFVSMSSKVSSVIKNSLPKTGSPTILSIRLIDPHLSLNLAIASLI